MLGFSAIGQVAVAALPSPTQGLTLQLFAGVSMGAILRASRVLEVLLMLSPVAFAALS